MNRIEAAVMGAVLSAVSPALVVPRMVKLIEEKWGTGKSIPQMILAGASCDDIFVIVLFSTFVTMAQGGSAKVTDFLNIPISIVLGVLLGAVVGIGLYLLFDWSYQHKIRNSTKVIILLGTAFLLMSIETLVKPYVALIPTELKWSGSLVSRNANSVWVCCLQKEKIQQKHRLFSASLQ